MKILLIICCLFLTTAGIVSAKNTDSLSTPENSNVIQQEIVQKATFAGGCFWCMEKPFEQLNGVVNVVSGYTGGSTKYPDYNNYMSGGHIEVVEITFNPEKVSYQKLLEVYWMQINPTDAGGQFVDRGYAYSTAIFYHDDKQRDLAEASKDALTKTGVFDTPIVTPIIPAVTFYTAEEYHQDYYKKNPLRYKYYRSRSGRDTFLNNTWKDYKHTAKMSKKELKKKLTPLQYQVTQKNGTEPPFANEYWDNKEQGIYVDIVSDEPLFSSLEKYKSGTGWPSFSHPLVSENIIEKEDKQFFSVRTEVRSKNGDSHLGHVFNDGPPPKGLRYCINSASLRFIPVENLEAEGFGEFAALFDN